jgi:YfiH family protein
MAQILHTKQYAISFGDQSTALSPQSLQAESALRAAAQYTAAFDTLGATRFSLLRQIHSTQGYALSEKSFIEPSTREGDYLITNTPGIALCIATADCAPVIIYSSAAPALAMIHAGWRGIYGGIIERAIEHLTKEYQIAPDTLTMHIGPTARSCCYTVQKDFPLWGTAGSVLKNDTLFFDLPTQCATRAKAYQIETLLEYAQCTICSPDHCSFRREGAAARRQITSACIVPKD